MVVVAIIGILAGIAIPNYSDYVTRSRVPNATSGLATKRTQMEQFFQDNHTFSDTVAVPPIVAPACVNDTTNAYFDFACDSLTATTYRVIATGKGPMTGFTYTVNQSNVKTSAFSGAPAGWVPHTPDNCWVTSKGGAC